MEFYIFRVLFPAILIDIALTVSFLRKGTLQRRNRRALSAFVTAPLYIIAALFWSVILGSGDPRFQGQGVLGLFLLMALGIFVTFLRLLLGLILFIGLRHR
jgi:hypothetical protein